MDTPRPLSDLSHEHLVRAGCSGGSHVGVVFAITIAVGLSVFIYFVTVGRKASAMEKRAVRTMANAQLAANQQAVREREKVINEYGAFIARCPSLPTRIEDVSVLPHSKETILNALLLEIARGHTPHMNAAMVGLAMCLAQYQPGVGSEPLEMLGMNLAKLPVTDDLETFRAQAERFLAAEEKTRPLFDEFNKLVAKDLDQINAKIAAAERLRREVPEEQKMRVLGGRYAARAAVDAISEEP